MALISDNIMTGIAQAIREKEGSNKGIKPVDMPKRVSGLGTFEVPVYENDYTTGNLTKTQTLFPYINTTTTIHVPEGKTLEQLVVVPTSGLYCASGDSDKQESPYGAIIDWGITASTPQTITFSNGNNSYQFSTGNTPFVAQNLNRLNLWKTQFSTKYFESGVTGMTRFDFKRGLYYDPYIITNIDWTALSPSDFTKAAGYNEFYIPTKTLFGGTCYGICIISDAGVLDSFMQTVATNADDPSGLNKAPTSGDGFAVLEGNKRGGNNYNMVSGGTTFLQRAIDNGACPSTAQRFIQPLYLWSSGSNDTVIAFQTSTVSATPTDAEIQAELDVYAEKNLQFVYSNDDRAYHSKAIPSELQNLFLGATGNVEVSVSGNVVPAIYAQYSDTKGLEDYNIANGSPRDIEEWMMEHGMDPWQDSVMWLQPKEEP